MTKDPNTPNKGNNLFRSLSQDEQEKYVLEQLENNVDLDQILKDITPPVGTRKGNGTPLIELFENYIVAIDNYVTTVANSSEMPAQIRQQSTAFKSTIHTLAERIRDSGILEDKKED